VRRTILVLPEARAEAFALLERLTAAARRFGPALGLMRLIKRSINRNSIMNPSNIFSV
jgi:hypothetical protein